MVGADPIPVRPARGRPRFQSLRRPGRRTGAGTPGVGDAPPEGHGQTVDSAPGHDSGDVSRPVS